MNATEIKFGLAQVNSWSNKRDILVGDTCVGLRITDDRCGGFYSCHSCKRRTQEIEVALQHLQTKHWWQKYENGHWIMLERPLEQDPIEFLKRSLRLSLKDIEWTKSTYGPKPDHTKACHLA